MLSAPSPRQRRCFATGIYLSLLIFLPAGVTKGSEDPPPFLFGAGIADITGPAAEARMMGYGRLDQQTAGIHTRLWSRAFIVADPTDAHRRVVFVTADLGQLFQSIKQGVVKKLQGDPKLRSLYRDENVMLTATHTHGGPGGYSHYFLYNSTTLGFLRQNYNKIVGGIYESIRRAHQNLAPGSIQLAHGQLLNAGVNRSPKAYRRNPSDEQARYQHNTDREMVLLRFTAADGKEWGCLNWFAVHGTSMSNRNHLISGDNKGYAAHFVERLRAADYDRPKTYVAGFAQGSVGDVSPNIFGGEDGGGRNDFESTAISGRKQADQALKLLTDLSAHNDSARQLRCRIDWRQTYVDFSKLVVQGTFTDGQTRTLAPAAIGASMLAGAEDGRGFGREGLTREDPIFDALFGGSVGQNKLSGQGIKPVVLETGTRKPHPWTPQILPVQILRIGRLAIVGMPGEPTTMAGRRIRQVVKKRLAMVGVQRVVIAGMANAYAGYFTTREEYDQQDYEGASTHFGPWTNAGFRQEFDRLAMAMSDGKKAAKGPQPLDLSDRQSTLQIPVVLDLPKIPGLTAFGEVARDARGEYGPGDRVVVQFWGGHPKNMLAAPPRSVSEASFLRVERKVGRRWVAIAHDWAPETIFRWSRVGGSGSVDPRSKVTIEWTIDKTVSPGRYRIFHRGVAKTLEGRKPYSGRSREFSVRAKPVAVVADRDKIKVTNATSQSLQIHVFNGNDGLRIIPRAVKKLKPGRSFTLSDKRFHIKVFASQFGRQLGSKVNVAANVRITKVGSRLKFD